MLIGLSPSVSAGPVWRLPTLGVPHLFAMESPCFVVFASASLEHASIMRWVDFYAGCIRSVLQTVAGMAQVSQTFYPKHSNMLKA